MQEINYPKQEYEIRYDIKMFRDGDKIIKTCGGKVVASYYCDKCSLNKPSRIHR